MKSGKVKKAKINIFWKVKAVRYAKDEKLIKKAVLLGLKKYAQKPYEINIIFVTNTEIKKLNKKYLGKNRFTDVIAFNLFPLPLQKRKYPERSLELVERRSRRAGVRGVKKHFLKVVNKLQIPPAPFTKGGVPLLPFGDIFVSLDQAKKQAKQLKHPLKKELLILAVHGALHLAGYEDNTSAQKQKMQKETEKILKNCGSFVL
jgi:probable rRNA maturation factor